MIHFGFFFTYFIKFFKLNLDLCSILLLSVYPSASNCIYGLYYIVNVSIAQDEEGSSLFYFHLFRSAYICHIPVFSSNAWKKSPQSKFQIAFFSTHFTIAGLTCSFSAMTPLHLLGFSYGSPHRGHRAVWPTWSFLHLFDWSHFSLWTNSCQLNVCFWDDYM